MSNSAPQSIADTTLGFTPAELQIFRHHQQVLAQQRAQQEAAASRGRGASRQGSNPSSRAASAASSGGQGRVFLDPRNLQTLHNHFDNLMRQIGARITQVCVLGPPQGWMYRCLANLCLSLAARRGHSALRSSQQRPGPHRHPAGG